MEHKIRARLGELGAKLDTQQRRWRDCYDGCAVLLHPRRHDSKENAQSSLYPTASAGSKIEPHDLRSSHSYEQQQAVPEPKDGVTCRAQAAAKQMCKDWEGHLNMLERKVAHASCKDAKRRIHLGE